MANITREDVLKLAKLSKLELSEEQVERFTREIGELVQYVEQLQAVDVTGLDPTDQVTGLKNVMRPDEMRDYGAGTKELLKNAPDQEQNQIKTKRVIG